MDKRPINFKPISTSERAFYQFSFGSGFYILYDSGMGDPVGYGSIIETEGKLNKEATRRGTSHGMYMWEYKLDSNSGWKEFKSTDNKYKIPDNGYTVSSPNLKLPRQPFKVIQPSEKQFFWFNLGTNHVLYDSDMGLPVSYGSRSYIIKTIFNINKAVRSGTQVVPILWYYERDSLKGWNKKPTPVAMDWKIEARDKKEAMDQKKREFNIS